MAGRRDAESFWPASPATPPTLCSPVDVDVDEDWIPDSVDLREDLGEAPVDPRGIVTPSGMVIRTHAAGVKKRAMAKKRASDTDLRTIMKRPSGMPVGNHVPVTQQPLDVVNRPGGISIMKRPASSTTPPAASALTSEKPPSTRTVPIGDTFKGMIIKMKYAKTGAIGIRLRGGRQLMQVQCNGAHQSLIDLWADQCIKKLEKGEDVEDVKDWLSMQKVEVVEALERHAGGAAYID
jgi:hypothetical protein